MDINSLVGIPWLKGGHDYKGADCWGIVHIGLRDLYGINMGVHLGSMASGDEMSMLVNGQLSSGKWCVVDDPLPGDVVLMYATTDPHHIGLYIGRGRLLHAYKTVSSIQPIDHIERMFRHVEFYRWRG